MRYILAILSVIFIILSSCSSHQKNKSNNTSSLQIEEHVETENCNFSFEKTYRDFDKVEEFRKLQSQFFTINEIDSCFFLNCSDSLFIGTEFYHRFILSSMIEYENKISSFLQKERLIMFSSIINNSIVSGAYYERERVRRILGSMSSDEKGILFNEDDFRNFKKSKSGNKLSDIYFDLIVSSSETSGLR